MGFQPMASALALQCSTNWAMNTHTLWVPGWKFSRQDWKKNNTVCILDSVYLGTASIYSDCPTFWACKIGIFFNNQGIMGVLAGVLEIWEQMSKLEFFLSWSHIGWDSGFSSKIRRIPTKSGWLDSLLTTRSHLNK